MSLLPCIRKKRIAKFTKAIILSIINIFASNFFMQIFNMSVQNVSAKVVIGVDRPVNVLVCIYVYKIHLELHTEINSYRIDI